MSLTRVQRRSGPWSRVVRARPRRRARCSAGRSPRRRSCGPACRRRWTMSSRTFGDGGRGQREDARAAERLGRRAEPAVFGAEVVAPLADAVGLVDDEERRRRWRAAARTSPRWRVAPGRGTGTRARRSRAPRAPRAARRRAAVELSTAASARSSLARDRLDLVLLQRDQRRDDDRRPVDEQGGESGRWPTCRAPVGMTRACRAPRQPDRLLLRNRNLSAELLPARSAGSPPR